MVAHEKVNKHATPEQLQNRLGQVVSVGADTQHTDDESLRIDKVMGKVRVGMVGDGSQSALDGSAHLLDMGAMIAETARRKRHGGHEEAATAEDSEDGKDEDNIQEPGGHNKLRTAGGAGQASPSMGISVELEVKINRAERGMEISNKKPRRAW